MTSREKGPPAPSLPAFDGVSLSREAPNTREITIEDVTRRAVEKCCSLLSRSRHFLGDRLNFVSASTYARTTRLRMSGSARFAAATARYEKGYRRAPCGSRGSLVAQAADIGFTGATTSRGTRERDNFIAGHRDEGNVSARRGMKVRTCTVTNGSSLRYRV